MTWHDVAIVDLIGQELTQVDSILDGTLSPIVEHLNPKGLLWVGCEFDPQALASSGPFVIAEKIANNIDWRFKMSWFALIFPDRDVNFLLLMYVSFFFYLLVRHLTGSTRTSCVRRIFGSTQSGASGKKTIFL